MKKIITIAIAVLMVLALAVPAFATPGSKTWATGATNGTDTWDGSDSVSQGIDVPASYVNKIEADAEGNAAPANYVVVLTWEVNSTLKYNIDANSYLWVVQDSSDKASTENDFGAAAKAGYEGDGYWTGAATVNVTVTNWSNRAITAGFAYADKTASVEGIEANINTANNNARAFAGTVTSDNGTWTADATAYLGGTLALNNPAKGVGVLGGITAEHNTAGSVALTLTAGDDTDATHETQYMDGQISQNGIAIGTLTVTIADNTPNNP